jgi:bacteriocin biosynthesis cyclodehydratase domain-containing protein
MRFRSDYEPVRLPGGQLVVVGEDRSLLIDDPAAADLAHQLDGRRTLAEALALLGDRHSVSALGAALGRLRDHGLLAAGPLTVPADEAAGWDARGVDPEFGHRWPDGGDVVLVDAGAPAVSAVSEVLAGVGLAVRRTGVAAAARTVEAYGGAPVVVAPRSMTDPRLAAVNAALLAAGRDWILIRPHGNVVLVGPHLVPGQTGCWECLRRRWLENEQVESFLADQVPDRPRAAATAPMLPGIATAAAGLLAAELPVLAAHGRSARLTGRMLALDTRDLSAETHHLVRQPHCPACGDPDLLRRADPRIALAPTPVRAGGEGGTRAVAADETYRRVAHHVGRYLGVVTRLTPLEAVENGVTHGYAAGHNFAQPRHLSTLRRNLRGNSGGKGRTDTQARVSAVGEALERYCGVWRGDRAVRRASYRELGPRRAVHLRELLLFSDRQYAERDARNPHLGHLHRVPNPLRDDVELDWVTGWSLTRDVPRELPAAYCWYGHPELTTVDVCSADSNGCAAGTSLPEAILQGFCELVERDSVALWWYHRSRMPGVDLDSFRDPWIDLLRAYHRDELRRETWALDLTADLGIPAYAAVSRSTARPVEDVIVGFGAHLDPGIALTRALTEVNQFLAAVPGPTAARPRYGINDPETVRWFTTVRVADQPWLAPDPSQPASRADRHPMLSTGDISADVRRCVERAASAGLEVIVLDQSRPDLELAVARVVVPGLRHFWRRLGPGRLWDVPARLRRRPIALDEDAINPLNVFF